MTEDLPEDTIIDLTQPGVVHRIYPTGRKPGLMDPNVGGFFGNKKEYVKEFILPDRIGNLDKKLGQIDQSGRFQIL